MEFKPTREFMITNRNLNTMIKPNNIEGQYTVSGGRNTDAGVQVNDGKINHHTSMVLDIIYDNMYRMFNEIDEMNFIASSLTKLLASNDGKRQDYFKTLITDTKLDFYLKVLQIGSYYMNLKKDGISMPFTKDTRDFLLHGCPYIIENAFPPEFYIPYRAALESKCEKEGNLNEPMDLLVSYEFEKKFFTHILEKIFYGKLPSYNGFKLNINLNSIFENNERSIYVLKKWFNDANSLKLAMTYPITCFSDSLKDSKYLPKKLFVKSYMLAIPNVSPIVSSFDKSKMEIDVSLANKFMAFFAHDAKMCVGTYVPSSLYTLNSNAYFIGKAILNTSYYNKKTRKYANKLNYKLRDMFKVLNLPEKDSNNGNNSHRRKAIFKALRQLDAKGIIKINKMNSERIQLNYVWNIANDNQLDDNETDNGSFEVKLEDSLDGCNLAM